MATVDMFLKIDDLQGESQDLKHGKEIDVLNWQWGATQAGSSQQGGGSGTGKAAVQDLTFVKRVCRASPVLFGMCCGGKPFTKAVLVVRKAGAKPVEYIKITMNGGIISSHQHNGGCNGEDLPTETVTLNFSSFTYEYTPQKANGEADASVSASFNIAGNAQG